MKRSQPNRRRFALEILEEKLAPSGGLTALQSVAPHAERAAQAATTFAAKLTGAQEIPQRDTPATGRVTAVTNNRETKIVVQGVLKKLTNVDVITLNIGPADANGPIVTLLVGPLGPNGGPFRPQHVRYVVTEGSLVGPLNGHPLSELVNDLRAGHAYINVGTLRTIIPNVVQTRNTGPGDFPGGEIRGQFHPIRP